MGTHSESSKPTGATEANPGRGSKDAPPREDFPADFQVDHVLWKISEISNVRMEAAGEQSDQRLPAKTLRQEGHPLPLATTSL